MCECAGVLTSLQVRRTAAREVEALKTIIHDNIVRLIETFCYSGRLFLVFELADQTVLQVIDPLTDQVHDRSRHS